MAKEQKIQATGDGTGVRRWQWPLIGALLFGLVLVLVYVVAAFWG